LKLDYFSSYFWRVRGHNSTGYSDWSNFWSFETEEEGYVEDLNTQSDSYYLNDNVPNPFVNTTSIEFGVPKSCFVSLNIYNEIGILVSKVISENLNSGTYRAVLSANDFVNGVYYYRLQAGNYSAMKKLVVVK
ncbi:MAG: T9SS type A sorting domain-containing protein, partial [Bacteroidota bacterium]